MFFGNLFSNLSQIAKDVVHAIKGGESIINESSVRVESSIEAPKNVDDWLFLPLEEVNPPEVLGEQWAFVNLSEGFSEHVRFRISNYGNYEVSILNERSKTWQVSRSTAKLVSGCQAVQIGYSVNGVQSKTRIVLAKAVLEAFVGPQPVYANSAWVRMFKHKDGNALNNHVENVSWLTLDEYNLEYENVKQKRLASKLKNLEKQAQAVEVEVDQQPKLSTREEKVLAELDHPEIKEQRLAKEQLERQEQAKAYANARPVFVDYHRALREEIWLPIPRYENTYEISSFGNIRSLDRFVTKTKVKILKDGSREEHTYRHSIAGRRLKPYMKDGQLVIGLSRNGQQSMLTVARLVIAIFARDRITSRNFEVMHLNGNSQNCRLNNLRIVEENNTQAA